jgi:hypothetical protein
LKPIESSKALNTKIPLSRQTAVPKMHEPYCLCLEDVFESAERIGRMAYASFGRFLHGTKVRQQIEKRPPYKLSSQELEDKNIFCIKWLETSNSIQLPRSKL